MPWRRDLNQMASEEPGAVHFKGIVGKRLTYHQPDKAARA